MKCIKLSIVTCPTCKNEMEWTNPPDTGLGKNYYCKQCKNHRFIQSIEKLTCPYLFNGECGGHTDSPELEKNWICALDIKKGTEIDKRGACPKCGNNLWTFGADNTILCNTPGCYHYETLVTKNKTLKKSSNLFKTTINPKMSLVDLK